MKDLVIRVTPRTKRRVKTALKVAVFGMGVYFLLWKPKLFFLWLLPGVPPPGPFGGAS